MRTDGESKHRVARRRLVGIGVGAALIAILTAGLMTAGAAASPAEEEYTLDLPSASNSGAGDDSGGIGGDAEGSDAPSDDSGDTETAPPPPPPTDTETETDTSTGSGGSGGGNDGPTGQRAGDGKGGTLEMEPGGEATPAQPHTVPAIATDVASEGGIPLLLAGLVAVVALAVFLAIWKRRRPSPEG